VIDGCTRLYGLVRADPRASWSPAMHRAAFEAQGLNAAYVPLTVRVGELDAALAGAHALGFFGLNVGAPHKRTATACCAKLDEVAAETGAVNTLCRLESGWRGYNTDAVALHELLAARAPVLRTALVLGGGGAACATVWALLRAGVRTLVATQRSEEADAVCGAFGGAPRCEPVPWLESAYIAHDVDCVVNAIPCDTEPALEIGAGLRREQVVVDWVYGGTSLTTTAHQLGCPLVRGDELLVRQGALANALWTDQPPPDVAMTAALSRVAAR